MGHEVFSYRWNEVAGLVKVLFLSRLGGHVGYFADIDEVLRVKFELNRRYLYTSEYQKERIPGHVLLD